MKRLFFVFAFIIPLVIHAQTLKTDVLVIGSGNAAYAASFQSFKSGVKTILLTQKEQLDLNKTAAASKAFYQGFLKRETENAKSLESPKPKPDKKNQTKVIAVDSTQLLNVINNTPYTEIKRSGSGWEIKLSKDKSIKAKILVLADNPEKLIAALKINALNPASSSLLNYNENTYRTTVASVASAGANFLSLYSLLIPNQENLLYIPADQFEIGSAAGATAAYAAFFDTKTSLSNLKRIQGELLSYKHALMPFEDVKPADSNWLAIQKVGISGIIKAEIKQNKAYFNPEKEVSYAEIKEPIKEYYYKAQLWFDDHQNIPINLENTISLVCYVGNKSVEATKAELQKKWNKNYRFKSSYNLKKILTRREFSVIINEYLKPFDDVNVDKTGRVIR
ncbi:MAG: FAD-binding protein [Sphingobacteriaceae bacterium]|nr:FAD-binding protein [Sphingobacteriaceae bacterium]